jgi:hypothetical protein
LLHNKPVVSDFIAGYFVVKKNLPQQSWRRLLLGRA